MSDKLRVVLAQRRRPEKDSLHPGHLIQILQQNGCDVLEAEKSDDLRDYLQENDSGKPSVIILGAEMKAGSPLDVLAELQRTKETNVELPPIVLLTQVKQDHEFLDLWRKRGVQYFVDPYADPRDLLKLVEEIHFKKQRRHRRFELHRSATLTWAKGEVVTQTVDISIGGLMVAAKIKALGEYWPGRDEKIKITCQLSVDSQPLELPCVVRIVREEKGFMKNRVMIGTQFDNLDEATKQAIKDCLDLLSLQMEASTRYRAGIF